MANTTLMIVVSGMERRVMMAKVVVIAKVMAKEKNQTSNVLVKDITLTRTQGISSLDVIWEGMPIGWTVHLTSFGKMNSRYAIGLKNSHARIDY